MVKLAVIVLAIMIILIVGTRLVSAQLVVRPAGPGLGWHNDWWNPETRTIQNTPYVHQ